MDLFFSLRKRNSWLSLAWVFVCIDFISAFSSSPCVSQSIEHWISPSKLVGNLAGINVILMFWWELGSSSPDIGSNLRLSPHIKPDFWNSNLSF